MNRAERRANKIKTKEPIINIKASDLEAIKQDAVAKACQKAFFLMMAIPCMVIHDKFGEIMKRDGRETKFANLCLELYDTYQQGYVDLRDLHECLYQETGLRVEVTK